MRHSQQSGRQVQFIHPCYLGYGDENSTTVEMVSKIQHLFSYLQFAGIKEGHSATKNLFEYPWMDN